MKILNKSFSNIEQCKSWKMATHQDTQWTRRSWQHRRLICILTGVNDEVDIENLETITAPVHTDAIRCNCAWRPKSETAFWTYFKNPVTKSIHWQRFLSSPSFISFWPAAQRIMCTTHRKTVTAVPWLGEHSCTPATKGENSDELSVVDSMKPSCYCPAYGLWHNEKL